jgi:signal peptidase II
MLAILIGLGVLLLDQLTKQWVRSALYFNESIPVIDGFFNIVYVRNPGAAWGILGGQNLILILISLGMLIMMVVCRRSILGEGVWYRIMYGLVIGGIAGNLIDRIRFAWVTDFLDFRFWGHPFPSFNVADSAICIGFAIYFFLNYRDSKLATPAEAE